MGSKRSDLTIDVSETEKPLTRHQRSASLTDTLMSPKRMLREKKQASSPRTPKALPSATLAKASPGGGASPRSVFQSPRKTCAVSGCKRERFAKGYCAIHVVDSRSSAGTNPITPTGFVRKTFNLWNKNVLESRDGDRDGANHLTVTWEFVFHGEHRVEMVVMEYQYVTIRYNGNRVHREDLGAEEMGVWTHTFTISAQESVDPIKLTVAIDTTLYKFEHDLLINDLPFHQAREKFFTSLSQAQLEAKMAAAGAGSGSDSTSSGADVPRLALVPETSSDAVSRLRAVSAPTPVQTPALERAYITANWHKNEEMIKSSYGYPKSRIQWQFTINGRKHSVQLEHGHKGGKRKITCDGNVMVEKKLGLLEANRSDMYTFTVDDVVVEVVLKRLSELPKQDAQAVLSAATLPEDEAAAAATSLSSAGVHTENAAELIRRAGWAYDLHIDGTPFEVCRSNSFNPASRVRVHASLALDRPDIDQRSLNQHLEQDQKKQPRR